MEKLKQVRERITFMLVIMSLLVFMLLYVYINQSHVSTLEQEKDQLQMEKHHLQMELGVNKTNDTLYSSKNSYYQWSQLEETANTFVKDSNGLFKKSWALYLVNESYAFGIDPRIPYELLKVETGGTFDPSLIGPKTEYGHAYGLGQFMKNTAPWIAEMSDVTYEDNLLFDPFYSIHLTFVYLDFLHNQYGNWDKALTAYHRGIGGLENYLEKNGHAKSWYATEIMDEITKK